MSWSTREHGSWQRYWSATWPRSPLVGDPSEPSTPFAPVQWFERPKTVPRKVQPRNLSGSECKGHHARVCYVHNVVQNSKWLFDAVRGMPTIIIPGFTLRHARTVASCASSSVKSHVPSNKATPRKGRVVPTLLISRFPRSILEWGFRFGHNSSIFLSMAGAPCEGPISLVGIRAPSN